MAGIIPLFFLLLLCEPVYAARLTYSACRKEKANEEVKPLDLIVINDKGEIINT